MVHSRTRHWNYRRMHSNTSSSAAQITPQDGLLDYRHNINTRGIDGRPKKKTLRGKQTRYQ
jgi:hypothetical protein